MAYVRTWAESGRVMYVCHPGSVLPSVLLLKKHLIFPCGFTAP